MKGANGAIAAGRQQAGIWLSVTTRPPSPPKPCQLHQRRVAGGGWGGPYTHTHTKCPFIQRDAAELLQWYTDLCTAYTTVIAFWRQSAGHGQATIQQRLEQDQSSSNDRETESERERERACQHRRLFSNPLYFFFFFVMCHFIIIIIIVISVDVVCIIALKFGDALYVLCVA